MDCILLQDDFTSFPIGSFPYDHAHTAMGEYHYYPVQGYTGQWYDPIVNANYRGPSWLITEMDGDRYMEQMRVRNPLTKNVSPLLVAGEVEWRDYTAQVKVRPLCTTEEAGLVFRYQTSLMNYAFYLNDQKVQFWKIHKKNRSGWPSSGNVTTTSPSPSSIPPYLIFPLRRINSVPSPCQFTGAIILPLDPGSICHSSFPLQSWR